MPVPELDFSVSKKICLLLERNSPFLGSHWVEKWGDIYLFIYLEFSARGQPFKSKVGHFLGSVLLLFQNYALTDAWV